MSIDCPRDTYMPLFLVPTVADTESQPRSRPRAAVTAEDDDLQQVSATEHQCLQESVQDILACQVLDGR